MGYSRSFPGPVGAQTSRYGPNMAPHSLPGGGGGACTRRGSLGAVLRFPRLVFEGLWKISTQIRGLNWMHGHSELWCPGVSLVIRITPTRITTGASSAALFIWLSNIDVAFPHTHFIQIRHLYIMGRMDVAH